MTYVILSITIFYCLLFLFDGLNYKWNYLLYFYLMATTILSIRFLEPDFVWLYIFTTVVNWTVFAIKFIPNKYKAFEYASFQISVNLLASLLLAFILK